MIAILGAYRQQQVEQQHKAYDEDECQELGVAMQVFTETVIVVYGFRCAVDVDFLKGTLVMTLMSSICGSLVSKAGSLHASVDQMPSYAVHT